MASPIPRSSFSGVEFPRSGGGILLNGEGPLAPVAPPPSATASVFSIRGRPSAITIVHPDPPSPTDTTFPNTATTATTPPQNSAESPRIRFAPLPDPHRPRSHSTGHNIGFRGSDGPNGEREYSLELRNMDNGNEHALGDSDDDGSDDMDGDDGEGGGYDAHGRRRSWVSMGMNMGSMGSWMGKSSSSKKGKKEKEKEDYNSEIGAPLKKSISSSMIPTSAGGLLDKLTPDSAHKRSTGGSISGSLLGTSPGTSFFGGSRGGSSGGGSAHRRGGSGDAATGGLGTSAPKVRMLNGRVYGARRASEAAAAEEMRRRKMEPEFVEWGTGQNRGMGTNNAPTARKTEDDDDGGGMAWVRKRREERQRRDKEEQERREREQAEGGGEGGEGGEGGNGDAGETGSDAEGRPASLSSSASSSSGARGVGNGPLTPSEPPTELVAFPPAIQIIPPGRGAAHNADTPKTSMPRLNIPGDNQNNHIVQAIAIPGGAGGPRAMHRRNDSDDYDDEDDGDFDDDDDDDEDMEAVGRFTSSAAGVEILSRHKT